MFTIIRKNVSSYEKTNIKEYLKKFENRKNLILHRRFKEVPEPEILSESDNLDFRPKILSLNSSKRTEKVDDSIMYYLGAKRNKKLEIMIKSKNENDSDTPKKSKSYSPKQVE